MSPRKKILRALSSKPGDGRFVRPTSIPGFSENPETYQKAVNELLSSRLVEGRKDDEGHMTLAVNPHRRDDVDKELRPLWSRPSLWAVVVLVGALGAVVTI